MPTSGAREGLWKLEQQVQMPRGGHLRNRSQITVADERRGGQSGKR